MPLSDFSAPLVLVVDDDVATRLLLKGLLAKQGYLVVEAANGQQAVESVRQQPPDLILMDVMMPDVDGYSACAQIRLLMGDESLPVVMLTAADDIESIEKAFNAGATDFITKPLNWALLAERVRYALRTGSLNREVRRARLREATTRRVAGIGYWRWSLDDDALTCSEDLELLTGVPLHRAATLHALAGLVHEGDRKRLMAAFERARDTGSKVDLEVRLASGQGERMLRLVGERGTQVEDVSLMFGVIQDVTDSRRAQALVDYLALHDETTGLGNRRLFQQQVSNALEGLKGDPGRVMLVGVIDLSRFGRYNDTLGVQIADRLLGLVGQRIKSSLGAFGSEVARLGGDEFAVMVLASDEPAAVQRFNAMLAKLEAPFRVDEHEVFVGLSSGFSLYPADAANQDGLLTLAQEAQRQARRMGHASLRCSIDADAAQRQRVALELELSLHKALERGEFFLVYQPQMNFATGRIVGAEALLRWRHPELGVVPPIQFVPLLEETGLIHDVGAWVVREAARQAGVWERDGLPLRIGVNLSPKQFLALGLFDIVAHACRQAAVSPSLIELEITESLTMQDVEHTQALLQEFREAGFKIAVDDFGVGHSSMEYLLKFPIDVIKIDRAFVMNITTERGRRAIVRAMTVLAQSLGMQVIAEGVETQRQCDFIEALGVNEVQGYLIGKPMSAEDFEAMARGYRRTV